MAGGEWVGTGVGDFAVPTEKQSLWTAPLRLARWFLGLPFFMRDCSRLPWSELQPTFENVLLPALRARGAGKIGLLGFCWGGWFVLHGSADDGVRCGVSCHPGMDLTMLHGERREDLFRGVKCPQLFLSSYQEAADVKPGGMAEVVLRGKDLPCEAVEYPQMRHGWVNRGMLEDPEVAREAADAIKRAKAWFTQHLELSVT
mmetsp:Transcript_27058/g.85026  ORF Transcript_27058/g.85026 Transcript_27058/m.85026 type:complete len:201 (+) Transcript_27058:232-834(+)